MTKSLSPTPPSPPELALAGFRFALAGGAWLTPRLAGRLFGLEPEANPVSPYLGRLFGARAAWLGAELMLAESPEQRRALVRRHMLIDGADLAATFLGHRGGYLTRRSAIMTGAGALTALTLAAWAISGEQIE